MMKLNKYFLFGFTFFISLSSFSQTKKELKKEKVELEKEINYTTELLNKTKSNKNKSLNYLKVLESQIKSKDRLLIALNIEISLINKQINKTTTTILEVEKSINNQERSLQSLKSEYAKMIYAAFKKKGKRNNLIFIISSEDFTQAYKRMIYLRQYSEFRKNQAFKIIKDQEELKRKKEKLANEKEKLIKESASKNHLVSSKTLELKSINSTKKERKKLVEKLGKSEKLFKKQLQDQQKKAKELDDKLRKIIEEEIRKTREAAKNKNTDGSFSLTPEAMALSTEFASNKGKLPWPLEKGIIVASYGKQKHPMFSGVETFNNGIDIATEKSAVVRVIFDGTVSRIFFIKGEGKAVLVNHGEYFSVYSGMKEVFVKAGDKLFSKEKIGIVRTEEKDNKTELHFEIWKAYDKHDPAKWLYNAY